MYYTEATSSKPAGTFLEFYRSSGDVGSFQFIWKYARNTLEKGLGEEETDKNDAFDFDVKAHLGNNQILETSMANWGEQEEQNEK